MAKSADLKQSSPNGDGAGQAKARKSEKLPPIDHGYAWVIVGSTLGPARPGPPSMPLSFNMRCSPLDSV